jgi:hypothetical protein
MGAKRKMAMIALVGAVTAGMSTMAYAAPKGGGGKTPTTESSIVLDQSAARLAGTELQIGSGVTFTTVVGALGGSEYPMVYVECRSDADGSVVYGQLDHPEVIFVLGGGSSPWFEVGGGATCTGQLLAYGGRSKGMDTIRLLAETAAFHALG